LKTRFWTPKKLRFLMWLLLAAAVVYGLDDLSVRIGVPPRPRFSTFTINRFYYINEKFNKFSYEMIPSVQERCVNALFPHSGSRPCWYVERHTMQTIPVN
jgi:hypothetical protein